MCAPLHLPLEPFHFLRETVLGILLTDGSEAPEYP
jgi:hypothetical protein